MVIYAADDERMLLEMLECAIQEAEPKAEVHGFTKATALIQALETGAPSPDLAFLDIEMPGITGLALAEKIRAHAPEVRIVFVTGFSQYAADAYLLHADGYIMKPVTAQRILSELDAMRRVRPLVEKSGKIRVQTFGNFEVFADEIPLKFHRKKAKELFAYLVDRMGATSTARELAGVLFEDAPYSKKQLDYLSKIVASMKETFEGANAAELLQLGYDSYAVNRDKLDCDLYRLVLRGEPEMLAQYAGDYMSQYSWGENTAAFLEQKLNSL